MPISYERDDRGRITCVHIQHEISDETLKLHAEDERRLDRGTLTPELAERIEREKPAGLRQELAEAVGEIALAVEPRPELAISVRDTRAALIKHDRLNGNNGNLRHLGVRSGT